MLLCCHNNFYASSNSIFWQRIHFCFIIMFPSHVISVILSWQMNKSVSSGVGISENPQQGLQTFITVKWTWVKYWTEYHMILYIWNSGVHLFFANSVTSVRWSLFLPCNIAKHLYRELEVGQISQLFVLNFCLCYS